MSKVSSIVCALRILAAGILLSSAGSAQSAIWPQWGQNPQHTGAVNVAGQYLNRILADIVYDPLVPAEQAANGGELLAHYQAPLVDGNDVYMEYKSGAYDIHNYSTQKWGENGFQWQNGQLVLRWSFQSDWNPPGSDFDFWEPVFHGVLAGQYIYVPGFAGSIFKLNRADGSVVGRIQPFPDYNQNRYTASPLSVDAFGNIYYNVLQLQGNNDFFSQDPVDSWLLKLTAAGAVSMVSYKTLVPIAKGPNDQCLAIFDNSQLPWPPAPDAVPSTRSCGSVRVVLNIAPAITPDGHTIYSVARQHIFSLYSYLVAVNADLTPKWAVSLRDRFHDGCGVSVAAGGVLPPNGAPGGCRVGAPLGVDPATNRPGAGRALDDSSSSPTIAPDGSVFFGAFSRYNYEQGHLMHFDANGNYLGAYNFGWDSTVAIYTHAGTYSVVIKDNHYTGLGSYCDVDAICPTDRTATNPASPEAYFITQLSPALVKEWSFQNTNTLACQRDSTGAITCTSGAHPHGFEWCVNAPLIDANGVVYANSEDGNLYAISQGGGLKQLIFQQLALGAAYTPASIDALGRIYSQNAGHLFVVGN